MFDLKGKQHFLFAIFFYRSTFVGSVWSFVFSSPPQQPMTSDFEGFLYQILSITLLSYLNSWERASIFLFKCWVLNKGTTGTNFIMSLVWCGPWLGIETGTSRTRSQHSTRYNLNNLIHKDAQFQSLSIYMHLIHIISLSMYCK